MKKTIIITLLTIVLISCKKNYVATAMEQEFQKGKPVKELIQLKEGEQLVAILETNKGNIEFELYFSETPRTVENFVGLSFQGYYNGITFHRVVRNMLIQSGDSTATGKGGRSYFGAEFEDEISYKLRFDSEGIVAMANRGPGTNTSQFFITVIPIPYLDGKHTIFGRVIEGMDVVAKIASVNVNAVEKPIEPIIINRIKIEKRSRN